STSAPALAQFPRALARRRQRRAASAPMTPAGHDGLQETCRLRRPAWLDRLAANRIHCRQAVAVAVGVRLVGFDDLLNQLLADDVAFIEPDEGNAVDSTPHLYRLDQA